MNTNTNRTEEICANQLNLRFAWSVSSAACCSAFRRSPILRPIAVNSSRAVEIKTNFPPKTALEVSSPLQPNNLQVIRSESEVIPK